MKRLISILLLVVVFATMLTACSKFTCDMCEKEKTGKKHEESMFGETIVICDDCYKALEDLAGALG